LKKTLLSLIVTLSATASIASNFVSADIEFAKDRVTHKQSTVEYYTMGKDIAKYQLDVQVRNAETDAAHVLSQSIEVGASKGFGPMSIGAGIGNEFGAKQYQYGYFAGGLSHKVGPVVASVGAKYSSKFDAPDFSQLVVFGGVSYPLNKTVSLQAGATRSYKDVKENTYSVGIKVGF
tara:strand:+ start:295 stop:825 length:531 start_codon:yes stop_codon:yes gene_type:complete